jgi:pyroglutamyl-peptidase
MHALAARPAGSGPVIGGFIHLPPLPEQAMRHPAAQAMALDEQVAALRLAIAVVASGAPELHPAAGRIA